MVFESFRRHQKQFLVALTLLAMFAFVLAQALDNFMSRQGSRGSDPVIATAWGKDIRVSQIQRMQADRVIANQFVDRARRWVNLPAPQQYLFPPDENNVLQALVLAHKAAEIGLSADTAMVTEYINDITENKLSKQDFFSILQGNIVPPGSSDGNPLNPLNVSEMELYRILSREIVLRNLLMVLSPAVVRDTPFDTYRLQSASEAMVQLEVVAAPASKFVVASSKPDEAKVKEVYEQAKGRLPDPAQGIAGFKRPAKAEADYVTASIDQFLPSVTVTDAEVEQYYASHKEEFRDEPTPSLPSNRNLPKPPGDSAIPAPVIEKSSPSDGKSAPSTTPSSTPASPKSQPTIAPTKDVPTKSPASEKPAAPKPTEKPSTKPESKPASKPTSKSGSIIPGLSPALSSIASTALFAEEKKSEPTAPSLKNDLKLPDAKKAGSTTPVSKETSSKEAKADAPTKSVAPVISKTASGETKIDFGSAVETVPPPPVQYKPLDQVRSQIVDRLRREKAGALAAAKLEKFRRDVLDPYVDSFLRARSAHRAKQAKQSSEKEAETFTPPPVPDFAKLAKDAGLTLKSTGLITFDEAAKLPTLGTAERVNTSSSPADAAGFPNMLFERGDQDLFRGKIAKNLSATEYYLFWKRRFEPERIPKLDEVRAESEALARLREAEPKAKEAAEKIAEEARKLNGDLAKALPKDGGYAVRLTRRFPRYIRRPNPLSFQQEDVFVPTKVDELPGVDNAFLEQVFKMKKGEIKVLPDQQKEVYYVIKLIDRSEPPFNKFVDSYNLEMSVWRNPRSMMMRRERFAQLRLVLDEVMREANFKMIEARGNRAEDQGPPPEDA